MLKDVFESKKCFKLVCGAGNQDAEEVKRLVAVYSKAGARFFDMSAKPEVVSAAFEGLKFAIPDEKERENYYLCVSVGINGDPHISKAEIDRSKCPTDCRICEQVCNQKATIEDKTRCIGCRKCIAVCPQNAIKLVSKPMDLTKIVPPLIDLGIKAVELHTMGNDEKEIDDKWNYLCSLPLEMLSLNVDRSKLGDEALLARVKRLSERRAPYTTIIQSDGIAMSGDNNSYKTTLQSVAITEFFMNKNLPLYINASGGTNAKTRELFNLVGVYPDGIAVGTYARKLVEKYTEREDFFENPQVFEEAVKVAKEFVDTILDNK